MALCSLVQAHVLTAEQKLIGGKHVADVGEGRKLVNGDLDSRGWIRITFVQVANFLRIVRK